MTDLYLKAVGGVVLTVIICLVLAKQGKEMALLLTIVTCCLLGIAAISLAGPIIQFMEKLQLSGNIDAQLFTILLKSIGIGLVTQIAVTICADAGNASLGKVLQYLACTVILCLCLPLMENLLTLVESILGNV